MPKPPLRPPYDLLAHDVIETLLVGHHCYRPDLPYPESHSGMQGAVEELFMMYEVKRRPIALAYADIRGDVCEH